MPITKEITLYTYEELSDSAKEAAKAWLSSCRETWDFDSVLEDFQRVAAILGIALRTHPIRTMGGATRYEPNIYWSLGYCQSDYASFEGQWTFSKGMAKAIREYAPKDGELHAIANLVTAIFAKGFYRDSFTVRYQDRYGFTVEPSELRWSDAATDRAEELREPCKRLAQWLYDQLRAEDEYMSSDEYVEEAMSANGYTFDEDGNRRN
jgi:hypothetical protein